MTRVPAVALALVLLAVARPVANGVSVRPVNSWTSNGLVTDAVSANGVVYLAGSFTTFGPRTGAMAVIDRTTNRLTPWPDFTGGAVDRVLQTPDGGYIVQGSFSEIDRRPANGLVRLTPAGSVDATFSWSRPESISMAAIAADRLVLTSGQVSALVEWRTGALVAGPLPFAIHAAGTGPGGTLVAWASRGDQWGLVQLDPTSGTITRIVYPGPAGTVLTAALVSGGTAFVAHVGSATVTGQVTAIDVASGRATTLATVTGGQICTRAGCVRDLPVTGLLHHRARLYLSGGLTLVNGVVRSLYAAIDAGTGALTTWQPENVGAPYAFASERAVLMAGDGDRLIVGATQTTSGDTRSRRVLMAVDADTGADTGWRHTLLGEGRARAAVAETSRLVVGGQFAGVGLIDRQGLAAISVPTGEPLAWQPQEAADRGSAVLAVSGSRVFVTERAGTSTTVERLTEYDAVTGVRGNWQVDVSGGTITCLTIAGDRLFVAGSFRALDGVPREGLASIAIDSATPVLEEWRPPAAVVWAGALRVLPGVVLVAGATQVDIPWPYRPLAALDAATGAVLPWQPTLLAAGGQPTEASDAALTADRFFIAGGFESIDGVPRAGLAAFDTSGRLLPWQADFSAIAWGTRLALFEGRGYVTGFLPTSGALASAAFDLTTGRHIDWAPVLDRSTTWSRFEPIEGLGLLRIEVTNGAGGDGAFAFHARLPSLSAVSGLRATVSGALVTLSWSPAADADRYVIEAGSAPGLSNLATIDTRSAATTFATVAPDGRYYVRVRGAIEGDVGPASDDLVVVVGSTGRDP